MAAAVKTILKKTAQEAIVKVQGDSGSVTIDLQTEIVSSGQVLDGATQTVNIIGLTWTGAASSVIAIDRNSTRIMTVGGSSIGSLDFNGQDMVPDTINNTHDIVVTISGGQGELWLKLRKAGGYKTTIEPEQFGSYDNPSVAGS